MKHEKNNVFLGSFVLFLFGYFEFRLTIAKIRNYEMAFMGYRMLQKTIEIFKNLLGRYAKTTDV